MTATIIPFPEPRKPWFTLSGGRFFARSLSGHIHEVSVETLFIISQNIEADQRFAERLRIEGLIEIVAQQRADLGAAWARKRRSAVVDMSTHAALSLLYCAHAPRQVRVVTSSKTA